MTDAEQVVRDLFEHYRHKPDDMPAEWNSDAGRHERIRSIADFIAGMTDRYALIEHARFFSRTPELR
jgi:dGTPase